MLKNIDLNKLKSFFHVYREGTLVGAARKLFVTPSAIHQSIAAFEHETQTTLFVKHGKKYISTEQGHALYGILNPFFQSLASKAEKWSTKGETPSGQLRIGAPTEYGSGPLIKRLAEYQKNYPDVRIILAIADTHELIKRVESAVLDLVICDEDPRQARMKHLSVKGIFEEELVMACSKSFYGIAVKGDHSFRNLSRLKFIPYHEHEEAIFKWFKYHFGKMPQIKFDLAVDSARGVLQGIQNDLGLGVLPLYLVKAQANFQVISTRKTHLMNQLSVVQLKNKVPSKAEKSLVNHLLNIDNSRPLFNHS